MSPLPLDGIRVADFTRIQAGPLATHWLVILGAEVIKIESLKAMDLSRRTVQGRREDNPDPNKSTGFMATNAGKKSCTLNLTTPRGQELARELIQKCDIVAENYATGVMERFGLDYQSLKKIKPDLIMVSTSGPGRTGPEKDDVAYAPTIHANSGLAHISGHPGQNPISLGIMWSDVITPLNAACAILAAVYHRAMTGQGQHIDVSMTEATVSLTPEPLLEYLMTGSFSEALGNRDYRYAPSNIYRCRGDDAWVAISVSSEEEWKALCRALGHPAWAKGPKFADNYSRRQNEKELDRHIGEWTKTKTPQEITRLLQAAGVAAGPTLAVDQLFRDPQLNERGFFVPIEYEPIGKGFMARMPYKLGQPNPPGQYLPPARLGEHNPYVFGQLLGLSGEEIENLVQDQIIY
ncbi:MAG: CoA transferase [Chloroflexi bacterium]|nr:CoA transferase [Chloroflexota bacterium]